MISWIDWTVLFMSLLLITLYGSWKTRKTANSHAFLVGGQKLNWGTICFSIMATQASAITFLSTPGQAYEDGMRFIQFYFGLPLAMIVISIFILPQYYKLKVQTAYEFLEQRFDIRVRVLTAILFLLLRGLSASITLLAPGIILSTLFGWSMGFTVLCLGGFVIIYTMVGGSTAVAKTHVQQMSIILFSLVLAIIIIYLKLPAGIGISESFSLAGAAGKMNMIDLEFNPNERYNIWSGVIASFFLFLSYFGTDQSQVQRYLNGKTLQESRLGLLFNGLLKVPMQFVVLLTGLLVYIFFLFQQPPLHFNVANKLAIQNTAIAPRYNELETKFDKVYDERKLFLENGIKEDKVSTPEFARNFKFYNDSIKSLRGEARTMINEHLPLAKTKDSDYIFMNFVLNYFPVGIIGLLLAMIFAAAMSSSASEISALATTTVVDIYKRKLAPDKSDNHYLIISRWITLGWGIILMAFAIWAAPFENLIQAVNILGSLFYGTILGIVLTAIFLKRVNANGVLIGAIIAESTVLYGYFFTKTGFLWFNVLGCLVVMVVGLIHSINNDHRTKKQAT